MVSAASLTLLTAPLLTLLSLTGFVAGSPATHQPVEWTTPLENSRIRKVSRDSPSALFGRRLSEDTWASGSAQMVDRCKIYNEAGQCLYCIRDSFLNATSGACQEIPFEALLPNCNVYSSPTTCYQCDANYAISNGNCVAASALPNCAVQRILGVCEVCTDGTLVVNGSCAYAGARANCAAYTNGTCSACQKGYALDPTIGVCWNASQVMGQIDPNCEDSLVNTGQYCNVCRQGYYLTNGQCVHVTSDQSEGCFVFDWRDSTKCLVCMPGFEIDVTDRCTFAGLQTTGISDPLSSKIASAVLTAAVVMLIAH